MDRQICDKANKILVVKSVVGIQVFNVQFLHLLCLKIFHHKKLGAGENNQEPRDVQPGVAHSPGLGRLQQFPSSTRAQLFSLRAGCSFQHPLPAPGTCGCPLKVCWINVIFLHMSPVTPVSAKNLEPAPVFTVQHVQTEAQLCVPGHQKCFTGKGVAGVRSVL